ncbi:MAG: DUF998 domain-containing protein [Ruminococcaceae bacterium]|nr:DUF998 domain-containing protein [Oscillospiraceae bacterium]
MKRKLINYLGLTGLIALISYAFAVVFSPLAYPGYNWMEQAVSDLSAESAPSRMLWNQLAALYDVCSILCVSCVSAYVCDKKIFTKPFRIGIYIFTLMNWISGIGYAMFPLADGGKEITSIQEIGHIAVTALVVILSIASLLILIISGFKNKPARGIAILALIAFIMMMVGAIGQSAVPPEYFGIVERFSVFSAVGFTAVLGLYLFNGFGEKYGA